MGEQAIARSDVLLTLVDLTATIAVAQGGAKAIGACIVRLGDRIKDLRDREGSAATRHAAQKRGKSPAAGRRRA